MFFEIYWSNKIYQKEEKGVNEMINSWTGSKLKEYITSI